MRFAPNRTHNQVSPFAKSISPGWSDRLMVKRTEVDEVVGHKRPALRAGEVDHVVVGERLAQRMPLDRLHIASLDTRSARGTRACRCASCSGALNHSATMTRTPTVS